MIKCRNCEKDNKIDRQICIYCGKKLYIEEKLQCLSSGIFLDRRYEIIELINSGGMGAVYKAIDTRLDDICAVKEMLDSHTDPVKKKQAVKNFKDEAKIITKLRHENLPRIRDYFIENERYYLVMDFIEGQDLEILWANSPGKKFQEKEVVEWALQILKLLDYLHTQDPPIIYRDIKPSNIIVKKNSNEIVLIDFGIAKTIKSRKSSRNTSSGTLGYCPPEQYEGIYTPHNDIYSLGATMHQLLSGELPLVPFKFKSIKEKNSSVSEEIENIIMKALKENPKERFSSAKDMIKSIIRAYKASKDQYAAAIALKYEIEAQLKTSTGLIDIIKGNGDIAIGKEPGSSLDQIDLLIIELDSPNEKIRRIAIEGLAKYKNEKAMKGVLKALKDCDPEVRKKAVIIAGNTGNPIALTYLINLLKDEEEEIRVSSAKALGKLMDKEALEPLIKALKDQHPSVRKQAAISLAMLDKREAIRHLEEARKKEGLLSINMKEAMSKAIERLMKGPSAEDYIEKGRIYMEQGKIEPARESFEKAVEINDSLLEGHMKLGYIYALKNDFASAEKYYKNAIPLAPDSGELHNSLGNIYSGQGKYEEAIKEYEKAIRLAPCCATAYNNLGFAYYNTGELYNAIVEYRKAMEIDNTVAMVYNNMGNGLQCSRKL